MTKSTNKYPKVNANQPYQIGGSYLIRTVTHYIAGRIVAVGKGEIVVDDAAWIADTGRFSDALKTGVFNEQEPYASGRVIINRASVIDATVVPLAYPLEKK